MRIFEFLNRCDASFWMGLPSSAFRTYMKPQDVKVMGDVGDGPSPELLRSSHGG